MALLLETSLGDITIDLDVEGSPELCFNLLKLAKARYFTNSLVYNVQPGRFCQMGDPRGDGTGGRSIYGLINDTDEASRFIKSRGRRLTKQELSEKGRVVAIEMGGMKDTIGSQFMITIDSGKDKSLDGLIDLPSERSGPMEYESREKEYLSLGVVVAEEVDDNNGVLDRINGLYCDKHGRPFADVRIRRAHILDDPFDEDPKGMERIVARRGIILMEPSDLPQEHRKCARWLSSSSPSPERPQEEIVEERISTEEALVDIDQDTERKRAKIMAQKEDRSNAVMLEMLGDISSADMKPPENILFVCKLNPLTDEEDLQLIFSRFDPNAKAEIIRDQETGDSLQYAFVEFDTEKSCNEAYFKMNNALIDDRRIKVDFSQSVSKEWSKYTQMKRGIRNSTRHGGDNNRRDAPGYDSRYYSSHQMDTHLACHRGRSKTSNVQKRPDAERQRQYDNSEDYRRKLHRSLSYTSDCDDKRSRTHRGRSSHRKKGREMKRSSHHSQNRGIDRYQRDREGERDGEMRRPSNHDRDRGIDKYSDREGCGDELRRHCSSDKDSHETHRNEEYERDRRKTSKIKSSRQRSRNGSKRKSKI